MAVISDYLDWRGDLTFEASPLNEVDNYIIAMIGCPDLTGIVPADEIEIGIKDAIDAYREQCGDEIRSLGVISSPYVLPCLFRLPETVRFGSLKLTGFVNRIDIGSTEQFSALTVRLPDGTYYVSFRGTDDTIVAWKENFHMAIMDAIPAQEDARRYLEWAMEAYEGPFLVGGHSKGGNLAVYASAMVPKESQDRILRVYNFDGPGFQDAFLEKEGYRRILPKLQSILPQHSIVGMLLSQGKVPDIVKSYSFGVGAHDGFTWQVLGTQFVRLPSLSFSSAMFSSAMAETLSEMDQAERRTFIDEFFDIMTSTGAFTLTDLTEVRLRTAVEMANSLRKDKEVQKFALKILTNSLADFRSYVEEKKNESSQA